MATNPCLSCKATLTGDNKSVEHILLNSIGGVLKSSELLCKTCNSTFGNTCDSTLSKQLEFTSAFMGVKRNRGDIPVIKGFTDVDGNPFELVDGRKPRMSKPEITITEKDGRDFYSISAKNEEQVMQVLNGLKREFNDFKPEEVRDKLQRRSSYMTTPLHISTTIGGDNAFKSICKTAIGAYIKNGGDRNYIEHLIPIIKGTEPINVVEHYHLQTPTYNENSNEVNHIIHIVGNADSGLLYAYVELFSTFSFIVLLSDTYTGEQLTYTYCYDIITCTEHPKTIDLFLSKQDFQNIITEKKNWFEEITRKNVRIMNIGQKRQIEKTRENIVENTVTEHFGTNEEMVSEEQFEKFCLDFAERIVAFEAHLESRNRLGGDFLI